jgi:hypothetical protein
LCAGVATRFGAALAVDEEFELSCDELRRDASVTGGVTRRSSFGDNDEALLLLFFRIDTGDRFGLPFVNGVEFW